VILLTNERVTSWIERGERGDFSLTREEDEEEEEEDDDDDDDDEGEEIERGGTRAVDPSERGV